MSVLPLLVFALTYAGMALGRVPGLHIDRSGIAIIGAAALLGAGVLTPTQAANGIDLPTLLILFGLMVLSAQYRLAGLYTRIANRVTRAQRPRLLLASVLGAAALLSAVLTNDVVCFALTPVVGLAVLRAGLPAAPFLVGIACASNIGSALTPIGNPQNVLIAQHMELAIVPFVLACAPAVAISLAFTYALLVRQLPAAAPASPSRVADTAPDEKSFDGTQAGKALALTAMAIVLFLSPVPHYLTALGLTGVVLVSRRFHTREILALVDWPLLVLLAGLFVVMRGFEVAGGVALVQDALRRASVDLGVPALLVPVTAILSNVVSNVPAVMLLLPLVEPGPEMGHLIALVSTFAGNAVAVGSIANLIVIEQARTVGITVSFAQHARVGLPVTAVSLLAAAASAHLFW